MKSLKLPVYSFKIKDSDGGKQIFDALRGKFVALTPEEWVRQNFLSYMINELGYPRGLTKVEASFRLNTMLRRADILVYSNSGSPVLIVECKAPEVKISQDVFDQIINYNFNYGVKYLIVTNGIQHFAAEIDRENNKIRFLDRIPLYKEVTR